MKLKNFLIVVEDVEKSKAFYKELFGLDAICDTGDNTVLMQGLVLQQKAVWESAIQEEVRMKNHSFVLYFEETDIESFSKKLDGYREHIEYVNRLTTLPWGQKMIRFYDPDGNLIEVRNHM